MESFQTRLQNLEKIYESNGTVSWGTFFIDPETHQNKVVTVAQNDFAYGTLRVRYPCKLLFTESVEFNPNRPNMNSDGTLPLSRSVDWMPYSGQVNASEYLTGDAANAYRLGFFSALTVETKDVIVDLNGFTLSQHPEHALMQRFFASIELADQPFLSRQGPADFGSTVRSANGVLLKNGMMGLSSHHHVHGNSPNNVWVKNVEFKNSEVASISINGGKNIVIEQCEDKGRRQDIPVLGSWSAFRFAILFSSALSSINQFSDLVAPVLEESKVIEKHIFDAIIVNKDFNTSGSNSDLAIFKNRSGLVDGPGYGMVFHPKGVAVGPFQSDIGKSKETCNLRMTDVLIDSVKSNPVEIPSLSSSSGTGNQVDMVGSVIQYLNTFPDDDGIERGIRDSYGHYVGTPLSKLQFAVAELREVNPSHASKFGTLSIDPTLIEWTKNTAFTLTTNDERTVATLKDESSATLATFNIRNNGDSMHHVLKGVLGLRVDSCTGLVCNNLTISNVGNEAPISNGVYGDENEAAHEGQTGMHGYWGNVTYGIRVSGSEEIELNNVRIKHVSSSTGPATGLYVQDSIAIKLKEMYTAEIHGGKAVSPKTPSEWVHSYNNFPNKLPTAIGVHIGNNNDFISPKNVVVREVSSPYFNGKTPIQMHFSYLSN